MTRQVCCVECDDKTPIPKHCKSPTCTWARCKEHGNLKLSAERRAWLAGTDED